MPSPNSHLGDTVSDLLSSLGTAVGTYAADQVTISVKTNLGPEIQVFDGSDQSPGLLSQLGIQAAVIVRDMNGNVLTTLGDVPPTNPIVALGALAIIATLGYVVVRGLVK